MAVTRQDQQVIPIARYEFSEDFGRYLQALVAENKAFERIWADNPLTGFAFEDGKAVVRTPPSSKLLREAVEYYVLNELSLHLSSHFENNPRISEKAIARLGRRDIPSVLLDNRCLELFSRPMEEREAFTPEEERSRANRRQPAGRVVHAAGRGGAIYDEFELILPAKASVTLGQEASLQVHTRRVQIDVTVRFDGANANLPRDFERLYLGRKLLDLTVYGVSVAINVKFACWALLTAAGWEYYRWLDSFIDRIGAGFSFERFLEDVGWSTARTIAHVQPQVRKPEGAG